MLRRLRWWMLPLVAAIALAPGCFGGGDDDGGDGDGGGAAASTTASATATATPAPFRVASPGALDSYRFDMRMVLAAAALPADARPTGLDLGDGTFTIEVEGEFVAPDREHSTTAVNLGFIQLNVERIAIGADAWVRQAGGGWERDVASADDLLGGDLSLTPGALVSDSDEALSRLQTELDRVSFTTETVNGVATRRYELDASTAGRLFGESEETLPIGTEDLDMTTTFWLDAETGIPVRLTVSGLTDAGEEAFELEMNLHDVGSDEITIEPPI